MGERGPAQTPREILKRRGSPLAKGRQGTPEVPPGIPRPPSALPLDQDDIHGDICEALALMGLLSRADEAIVGRLANLLSRFRKTAKWLEKYEGHENYNARASNLVRLSSEARQCEKALGLAPAFRSGLSGSGEEPDSPAAGFFKGQGRKAE